jgi:GNAT superfamily N-acetyltransferase
VNPFTDRDSLIVELRGSPTPMKPHLASLTERATAIPFAGMTYPHYLPHLLGVTPDGPVIAVGADISGPCGLVLARVSDGEGEVLSVLVRAEHRNKGIGTALVEAIEDRLRERGAAIVHGTYPTGKESTPAVERVLAKRGWDSPQPRMALFSIGPDVPPPIRTAPWFRPISLPEGFTLVNWTELSAAAKDTVARRVESGEVPLFVNPLVEEGKLDPRFSLGLLLHGEIVGWVIVHRTAEKVIRITGLYADSRVVPPGLGRSLLGEMLYRFIAVLDGGEQLVANWGIATANPFYRVYTRSILKYIPGYALTLTMGTSKKLT